MNKKGIEITMSTIVVAIIVLIVLIVVILIFTGKLGEGGQEIENIKGPYTTEKCEIPGTARTCRHNYICEQKGGDIVPNTKCDFGICCTI